jgi:hypothetical protein
MAAQVASGETAAAFCRREGIPPSRLYAWRRRLEGAVPGGQGPAFVELRPEACSRPTGIVLVSRGGWRVELSCGFDAATLQRLLSCEGSVAACWD